MWSILQLLLISTCRAAVQLSQTFCWRWDLWHGQNNRHGVESKDLYLNWLCCSIRNGFDKSDYPYLSQNLTWGFRNRIMCNTPVLFCVTWLVVIFIYLRIITLILREVLRKGVLLPCANLQFTVPDYMTCWEAFFAWCRGPVIWTSNIMELISFSISLPLLRSAVEWI